LRRKGKILEQAGENRKRGMGWRSLRGGGGVFPGVGAGPRRTATKGRVVGRGGGEKKTLGAEENEYLKGTKGCTRGGKGLWLNSGNFTAPRDAQCGRGGKETRIPQGGRICPFGKKKGKKRKRT